MKSIKGRVLLNMILTVAISLSLIGGMSILLNYNSTHQLLEQSMTESAKITADRIAMELKAYTNVAIEAGSIARLAKADTPIADKESIINQRAVTHGFERGNIIGADGISLFDGNDYSDREYFKESMAGRTSVSEPLLSKRTNKLAMIISAPLWENGIPGTTVVGVVYFAPTSTFLNDIVGSVKISANGSAYIVDKDGYTIAHKDTVRVEDRENIEELSKTTPELVELAAINAKMRAGENGFMRYSFGGVEKFNSYAPISDSDGWSIAINAPTSDFMSATVQSAQLTLIMLVLCIGAAIFVAFMASHAIDRPLKACTRRLELLADGDLTTPVPDVKTKDETGLLADVTKKTVFTLNGIIKDLGYILSAITAGNLNVRTTNKDMYIGDFSTILESLSKINIGLSDTMSKISMASEQVTSGASHVSSGAQTLAQGATEQASAVQELSSSISEVSEQIKGNTSKAVEATGLVGAVGFKLNESNKQMADMMDAMTEISNSSSQISKIIKTIEDIAFQTNILALNAAVEAARAGAAGKGFAVVADEVRNLATKSSEAAKQTHALIEGSVLAVAHGVKIASETASSLIEVVTGAQQVTELIKQISQASEQQSDSIFEINQGVEQIANVVQTNSATSEESAAASEELSGQADMMLNLISTFKLRDDGVIKSEQPHQSTPKTISLGEHDFGGGKY